MVQKYDYILNRQVFTVLLFVFYEIIACNTCIKHVNADFESMINKKRLLNENLEVFFYNDSESNETFLSIIVNIVR